MQDTKVFSVSIPKDDSTLLREVNLLAAALGMSRSALIVTLLKRATSNAKARVLIAEQSGPVSERSESILSELLGSKPAA